MNDESAARFHDGVSYPTLAYLEMTALFFGGNFVYHKNIFRRNNNKFAFGGFLLINVFTSYAITEATNPNVARYYAAAYNNTLELEHKKTLNAILRKKIFGK